MRALTPLLCMLTCALTSGLTRTAFAQAPPPKPSAPPPALELGAIDPSTFERYLARGPQPFIASLRVLPARKNGAFVGFKLAQIAPGSPADLGGLRVGDVVLRVNGLPIGRPEEWMRAWALVGEQRRVELEVLREGVTHRWLWSVQ